CTSDTGCTGTVTTNCTIPKETDVSFIGSEGYPINLSPPPLTITEITNQFLLYGRAGNNSKCGSCGATTPSGLGTYTVANYTGGTVTVTGYTQEQTNTTNPFLLYGRAGNNSKCGSCGATNPSGYGTYTVSNFPGHGMTPKLELDVNADVYDNAIGFRIKDDGSIGYRALKYTGYCVDNVTVTGVTVEEQYSASGMVTNNTWQKIDIRFVMPEYDECELIHGKARKGRLMFYVDCKLKFVAEEVDEFIARRLEEYKDKQLGVPFNFSLGGGSQGLLESMTFDGQDPDDLGLHIEQNFAGSFIGDISQFRFHICDLNWCELKHNCEVEKTRYEGNVIPTPPTPVVDGYYYGKLNAITADTGNITTLTFVEDDSVIDQYISYPSGAGYLYVAYPSTFTQHTDFRDSVGGCFGTNIPYVTLSDVTISGVVYKVYRSVNIINGAQNVWFCS
ncbi:MAG: hypothetical protein KAJ19_17625, partial [Gammaproteobacteria bacterium]|nr:hypothetical protein [Gammaproteobacteria bacterium]